MLLWAELVKSSVVLPITVISTFIPINAPDICTPFNAYHDLQVFAFQIMPTFDPDYLYSN